QHPAVPRDLLGAVGIIFGGEVASHAPTDRNAILDGRAGVHLLDVGLLVAAAALEQVIEWGDHADTDDVIVLRDVPEPALFVRGLDHERRPLVPARVTVGPFPVGPDGPLVQHRVPEAQLEAVLQQRALAAGINDHLRPHLFPRAVLLLDAHADGPA